MKVLVRVNPPSAVREAGASALEQFTSGHRANVRASKQTLADTITRCLHQSDCAFHGGLQPGAEGDMSRRVAVISATHPLPNPGMASVDMAILALIRRYRLQADVAFYRLYTPEERNPEMGPSRRDRFRHQMRLPIDYRTLKEDDASLENVDAILFWGDFLHSQDFLTQTAAVLHKAGHAASREEAHRFLLRSLYLSDVAEDRLRIALLFGGTLLFNGMPDYRDELYMQALLRLLSGCGGVWMRDLHSAAMAAHLVGNNGRVYPGVDAALLLREDDLDLFPTSEGMSELSAPDPPVGVFFGRNASTSRMPATFARALCEEIEADAEWLPWFDETLLGTRSTDARAAFPTLRFHTCQTPPTGGDLLRRLASYQLIVTDTYHICVNAWNLGIPTVCVGESFPAVAYDVSGGWYGSWRDKRQLFYSMHDALELYTTAEELEQAERFSRRLHLVLERLCDDAWIRGVRLGLRARADHAERSFLGELLRLLGSPPLGENGGGAC